MRDFSQLSKRASASLDGDSPREQEKSRISVIKTTQLFKHVRGLGDSWSNSIRAAADTK
ncbi:pyruvate kinase [Gardnerella vaginalis]|nr:pyruvate kinase [Gardnerella vaginalis]